jgi:cell wall-associated NlpC family hydrolase
VPVNGPIASAGAGHPEVIAIAKHYLGIPYKYGGASPATGFDCSGFVMYCYAQIGISLPHYSGYQQNMGTPVPMTALVPGDLVFRGRPVSYHVGMYAGGGLTIHSPHTGDVVRFAPLAGWEYAVRLR